MQISKKLIEKGLTTASCFCNCLGKSVGEFASPVNGPEFCLCFITIKEKLNLCNKTFLTTFITIPIPWLHVLSVVEWSACWKFNNCAKYTKALMAQLCRHCTLTVLWHFSKVSVLALCWAAPIPCCSVGSDLPLCVSALPLPRRGPSAQRPREVLLRTSSSSALVLFTNYQCITITWRYSKQK